MLMNGTNPLNAAQLRGGALGRLLPYTTPQPLYVQRAGCRRQKSHMLGASGVSGATESAERAASAWSEVPRMNVRSPNELPPQPGEPTAARPSSVTVTSRIELPNRTIAKVLLLVALLWLLQRLWPIVLLLLVSGFLALSLDPLVMRIERRGAQRSLAVLLVSIGLLVAIAGLGLLIVPPLIDEGQRLAEHLPDYADRGQRWLNSNPTIRDWLQRHANEGAADPKLVFSGVLSFGTGIAGGIASLLTVVVLTLYLLLDGPRAYRWVLSMLPPRIQDKVERSHPEVRRVIAGYVMGQVVTSLLFGVFTFVVLSVADVPEPLLLAVLAAVLDAIPLIGATAATIPAVLLAATISWPTAAFVLVAYVLYQQFENYVITPRVYGRTLQISSLAVLIAVLVGATLLGVLGALLAMPIAAVLPTIVHIWREEQSS